VAGIDGTGVVQFDDRVFEITRRAVHSNGHAADGEADACWYVRDVTPEWNDREQLHTLAEALRASLFPPATPRIPGMEVALRYRPADSQLEIGGDFLDVVRVGHNDWQLVVGDVCGKGPEVAALSGLCRHVLRSAAAHTTLPSDALGELHDTLLTRDDEGSSCSVVAARLELDTCGAWITLASAGHPRPILIRRSGWIDLRGQQGTVLGFFDDLDVADDRVGLGPGDALVFVTDGITDAHAGAELFGEELLQSLLLECANLPADVVADRVVHAALSFAGGRARDDIAVLVVRVPEAAADDPAQRIHDALGNDPSLPGYPIGRDHVDIGRPAPPREARMRLAGDPITTRDARLFVTSVLRSWRLTELADDDMAVLISELATNAVRHVGKPYQVVVRYDGFAVRVEVEDPSGDAPRLRTPTDDELSGRGLVIVDALADQWGFSSLSTGKRVWFTRAVRSFSAAPPESA